MSQDNFGGYGAPNTGGMVPGSGMPQGGGVGRFLKQLRGAGAFLVNTLPHLIAGVSGSPFQSPFASPPGEGLSPAILNVAWGFGNLVVGYLLVGRVGHFDHRNNKHALALGVGFLAMALMISKHFAAFHGGL